MKKLLGKTLMACAITAAIGFSGSVMAQQFAPFTISPDILDKNGIAPFDANFMNGGYNERLTFTTASAFNVSLWWNAGQYATIGSDGKAVYAAHGLDKDYGLYVLYTGQGTLSGTSLNFTEGGAFSVWLDKGRDSKFEFTGAGGAPIAVTNASDDTLLGTGVPLAGVGLILPTLCPPGTSDIGCGFFRGNSSLSLTDSLDGVAAQGSDFFTSPNPFYNLSFQTGQFNNLGLGAGITSNILGSLDISFANRNDVPEPTTIALLGLGMLGFAASRRKAAKSKNA